MKLKATTTQFTFLEDKGVIEMNAIPIYKVECVDHLDGERTYTTFQFSPETPESTYGYGPFGNRIGATIERGHATLIAHVCPKPGVTIELATSKTGETLLYINDNACGISALDVLSGRINDIEFYLEKNQ